MAESKPREHYFCEFCNRVLWVGDDCDCPESQKPKSKAKPRNDEERGTLP